jgi:hypothetical protein
MITPEFYRYVCKHLKGRFRHEFEDMIFECWLGMSGKTTKLLIRVFFSDLEHDGRCMMQFAFVELGNRIKQLHLDSNSYRDMKAFKNHEKRISLLIDAFSRIFVFEKKSNYLRDFNKIKDMFKEKTTYLKNKYL